MQATDAVVGANLGTRDEALMRDPTVGSALSCRFDAAASREGGLADSPPDRIDMRLDVSDGCLMRRTQYAVSGARFERLSLDRDARQAILTTIDPESGRFRRVLVGVSAERFADLENQRAALRPSSSCSGDQASREADFVARNRDLFQGASTSDLIWTCSVEKDR